MDISIVRAISDDAAEILALQRAAYQSEARIYDDWTIPPLTQRLSQIVAEFEKMVFLKAVDAGEIVGSLRVSSANDACSIGKVIVKPELQGKGIGTQLMLHAESLFPGIKRYELFTGSESLDNIRFYQNLGYRIFREEDLSPKVRLVFMEKLR